MINALKPRIDKYPFIDTLVAAALRVRRWQSDSRVKDNQSRFAMIVLKISLESYRSLNMAYLDDLVEFGHRISARLFLNIRLGSGFASFTDAQTSIIRMQTSSV